MLSDVADAELRGRRLIAELRLGDRIECLGNIPLEAECPVAEYRRDRIGRWSGGRLLGEEARR